VVPATNLVAFCLVAVPLILVPGSSVLFVVGRSLTLGRVGGLVTQSVVVFTVVKIVGAA